MCGDCKYFKPIFSETASEPYGKCQHPHGSFRGQYRYDYTAACKQGEITEHYETKER